MTGQWDLAIDFGTCFTCAAVTAADGGDARLVDLPEGTRLPSAVLRDASGVLTAGPAAARAVAVEPSRALRTPKYELARGARMLLGREPTDPEDPPAAVLALVAEEARRAFGGTPPRRVVLTHPVAWDADQRESLAEAARRAGLRQVVLVPEPVAAATYYAVEAQVPEGALVAVYDLGGGTFDAAVLRRTAQGFEAVAEGGLPDLGGETFDGLVHELVLEQLRLTDEALWEAVTAGSEEEMVRARARLVQDAREAKEGLSTRLRVPVQVGPETVWITRREFEQAILPDVRRSTDEFQRVLREAGVEPAALAALHLTGGSARIPLVGDLLAQLLGRVPVLGEDPKSVVALGGLRHRGYAAGDRPEPVPPAAFDAVQQEVNWQADKRPELRGADGALFGVTAGLPGGALAAFGAGASESALQVWRPGPGSRYTHSRYPFQGSVITAVEWLPSGQIVALGHDSGQVELWQYSGATMKLLHRLSSLPGAVSALRCTPDGSLLVGAGGQRTAAWRLSAAGTPQPAGPGTDLVTVVRDVAVHPGGRSVAAAGHDGVVRLLGCADGRLHFSRREPDDHGHAVAVRYSGDGKLLGTAGTDGGIRLFSAKPRRPGPLTVLEVPKGDDPVLGFSRDSRLLAVGTGKEIRVWDLGSAAGLASGRPIASDHVRLATRLVANGPVTAVDFADDRTLVSAGRNGSVQLWHLDAT